MGKIVCPRCNANVQEEEEQCPECKKRLKRKKPDIEDPKKIEETLELIDDETYEIKAQDKDTVIDNIKRIGSSQNSKERDIKIKESDKSEVKDEMVVYECPVCGTEVLKEDSQCPGCGAIFEE